MKPQIERSPFQKMQPDEQRDNQRVAIVGGTFNPVHNAHLRAAEEVREALGIPRVLFIPALRAPHKPEEPEASPELRLKMLELATRDNPAFEVSEIELQRGGTSYTIETVRELVGQGLRPTLIIGSDQFNAVASWCECEELFTLSDFVVIARPGYAVKKPAEALPIELSRGFCYDNKSGAFRNSFGKKVTYVDTTHLDISSSGVRRLVAEGLSIRYLVPPPVREVIEAEGLYKGLYK